MSFTIQHFLHEKELNRLRFKPRLGFSGNAFARSIYSDEYLINRLTLERKLEDHRGCVNTLYWSRGGDKLLSGSDDRRVNVWKPYEDYKLGYSIETGHRDNIFNAKFMPGSSDRVIVTVAGDSEVRVFDVNESEEGRLRHVYTCHNNTTKRIAVDDNPFEFMTCSEDGTVRHFDLRQPHVCTPHSINTFFGRGLQSSGQRTPPEGSNAQLGCPKPLLDYGEYNVGIYSMSLNRLYPQYFIVAGRDNYIFLHDRRMVGRGSRGAGKRMQYDAESRCIKRFTSTNDNIRHREKNITGCKFSESNGRELIGSWMSDGIYLFDMHDSPMERSPQGISAKSSPRPKRNNRDYTPFDERGGIIRRFRDGDLSSIIADIDDVLATAEHKLSRREGSTQEGMVEKIWALCMMSAVRLRRVHESLALDFADAEYRDEEIASSRTLIREAEVAAFDLRTMAGFWCLAVGLWIATGGQRSNGCEDREDWLRKAARYLKNAKNIYMTHHESGSPSTDAYDNTNESWGLTFDEFDRDIQSALFREGYNQEGVQETHILDSNIDRWKWLDSMYSILPSYDDNATGATQYISGLSSSSERPNSSGESDDEIIEVEISGTNDESNSDTQHSGNSTAISMDMDQGNSQSDDERDMSMDVETVEDTDEEGQESTTGVSDENDASDSDDDYDDEDDNESFRPITDLESDVGVVTHRKKYVGLCNFRTVKDVNFYGLHDEYIVSGSDSGYVFVWDKKTTKIVQLLRGDEDTVNIVTGHPYMPVMAVSGIDNSIKIFSPTSTMPTTSRKQHPNLRTSYSESSLMYDVDDIVARLQENNRSTSSSRTISHAMIAALTERLQDSQGRRNLLEEFMLMGERADTPVECQIQ